MQTIERESCRGIIETESIDQCYSLLFAKKQDRGLSWISKEQYIRNDIKCHYDQCIICNNNNSSNSNNSSSSSTTTMSNKQKKEEQKKKELLQQQKQQKTTINAKPIIIADIKVISEYLDILELESVKNNQTLVVLETVFRYIQYNSGPKFFDRLKKLITSNPNGDKVIYFTNDLNKQTQLDREQDKDKGNNQSESIDTYESRRIVNAARWFGQHLHDQKHLVKVPIYLITNNDQMIDIAKKTKQLGKETQDGDIKILGLKEYLYQYYSGNTSVLDVYESLTLMIKEKQLEEQNNTSSSSSSSLYERYWDDDIKAVELKSGNIVSGKIHINQFNREEAFVKIQSSTIASTRGGHGDKIMIIGKKNINRAIHGDKVGIFVLPESEWMDQSTSASVLGDLDDQKDDMIAEENKEEDQVLSSIQTTKANNKKNEKKIMTAKVVGIFQRNWRDYVGTIESGSTVYSNFVNVVPLDSRIPIIRVATKSAEAFVNKRIIVRIDRWDLSSSYPAGHYVSSVGERGSLETELGCLMVEHDISLRPWSKQILDSLPTSDTWSIPKDERKKRRIMADSGHRVMSIDPLGSKDIDDTISLARLDGDRVIEIGVHIADVTHFVAKGSPLDIEAQRRGTTIYLPDRRFDMLPAVLSEDLCSLWGGKERCAMSVVWRMELDATTQEYKIVDSWFGKTIINSCGEFHYQLAQDIIDGKVVDGKDRDEDVTNGGKNAGYRNRLHNNRRELAGALDLESIEVRFTFNESTKTPDRIVLKSDLEVHSLVAEYMILANAAVGTRIHQYHPGAALLRRHPPPNQLGFSNIQQLFDMFGFPFDSSSNSRLAESLKNAVVPGDPLANQIIKLKTVNVVSEAVYFSTGGFNVDDFYHYGLALNKYTHFTSPIRRYADIIVHRQLMDAVLTKPADQDDHSMAILADHLNLRHRASKTLQREATQMFQSLYFQHHPKPNVEAIITDIRSNSVIVLVPEYGLRDRVYLLDKDGKPIMPSDDNSFKSKIQSMVFNETNVEFKLEDGTKKQLSIFDHIVVNIHTQENDYHLPPVKMDFVQILKSQNKNTLFNKEQVSKKSIVDQIKKDEKSKDQMDHRDTTSNPYGFNLNQQEKEEEQEKLQGGKSSKHQQSIYELIKDLDDLKLEKIEQVGSRIDYSKGKTIVKKEKEGKVLKLWSMNDKQSKEYRTKADQYLRDAISKQYKQQRLLYLKQQQQEDGDDEYYDEEYEDDNEKIAPTISVKDKYGDLISKTEQGHLKALRDLSLSKRKFN
ncbi:Putative mitotic control protein [Cavenderia fasciculata]|uniref:DIS3-like exonuclease 1 n=1 Tax=Cavenderia fasciculata TaxID=261658 RepID=F4PWN2_CACFS|nr:Putative mitotic control protein [Cavenderia fasciculata]EGG20396.1 Putative mitotic control protein [Cavenderia fasciculata]|eukprot:XP_004367379.1 Putative mitotic control protein [Cavenderia fasciculata]